jgi:hypothetical protein
MKETVVLKIKFPYHGSVPVLAGAKINDFTRFA